MKKFLKDWLGAFFVILRFVVALAIAWNKRTEPERPKGRWIPVTERLPERKVGVLVYTGTSVFSHRFFATESVIQSGITHWMPLPEPPKEDAE